MFSITFHLEKVHYDRLKVQTSRKLLKVNDHGSGRDKNLCPHVSGEKLTEIPERVELYNGAHLLKLQTAQNEHLPSHIRSLLYFTRI